MVACNSATSSALEAVCDHVARRGASVRVVGVVGPESVLAVAATHNGRVGLLATPVTVANGAYERAVRAADPLVRLTSVPCPRLAQISQTGADITAEDVELVRAYCRPLRDAGVDTVILGCTHYPFVRALLQRVLGPRVQLVSAGVAVARRVEQALDLGDLGTTHRGEGRYAFLCTGDPAAFARVGTRFLQLPVGAVEHVALPHASPAAGLVIARSS